MHGASENLGRRCGKGLVRICNKLFKFCCWQCCFIIFLTANALSVLTTINLRKTTRQNRFCSRPGKGAECNSQNSIWSGCPTLPPCGSKVYSLLFSKYEIHIRRRLYRIPNIGGYTSVYPRVKRYKLINHLLNQSMEGGREVFFPYLRSVTGDGIQLFPEILIRAL